MFFTSTDGGRVRVIGAGPAGSAAAIAARLDGAAVELVEKSRLPRHKVCGEFLSPEIAPVLDRLGMLHEFLQARPARIRRMLLHFGRRAKSSGLPEPAFGLSRYRFDDLLYRGALAAGAEPRREPGPEPAAATVLAGGRCAADAATARASRLFGFKAHFTGPPSDTVELYFFSGAYVGIAPVEEGFTNVCGLAPQRLLERFDFDVDGLLASHPPLAERTRPLSRAMPWLYVGPLVFRNRFGARPPEATYPAGDALSFVDPFTGSGLLSAVMTGALAGCSAARGSSSSAFIFECNLLLRKAFSISTAFRDVAGTKLAEYVAPLLSGRFLYRLTRPPAAR
ncbi:MAG: tryptophan 7-halogenase [Acidobacteria bacterium]|nr:tryptophan 7-halogenase [Acidobacteriota bacterium]